MDSDSCARTLARLDEPKPVRLAVAGETVAGVVSSLYLGDECIRVDVRERDGERTFRVLTHWVDGWLDPVVDVRECDDAGFAPTGPLDDVTVSPTGRRADRADGAAAAVE